MTPQEAKERMEYLKDAFTFSLIFYYALLAFVTAELNPFDWGLYTRIGYAAAVLITTVLITNKK